MSEQYKNVAIPDSIHKELKIYAANVGTSLIYEATMAVINYIPKQTNKKGIYDICPSCGEIVKENELSKYCHICGQRIEREV